MGQKQSKGAKGKGKGKNAESPAEEAPAQSTTPSTPSTPTQSDTNESKLDWEAPVLYSENNEKVCADDFELLKVIGRGSFGKVRA